MSHESLPASRGPLPWLILAGVLVTGGMIAAQQFARGPARDQAPPAPVAKAPETARSDDAFARTVLAELRTSARETEELRRQLADEQAERKKLAADLRALRDSMPPAPPPR